MAGPFLSGFLGSLNQSIQQGHERAQQREQLDLQKKHLDAQLKQMDLQQKLQEHQLRAAMTKAGDIETLASQFGTPTGPAGPGTEGPLMESGNFYSKAGQGDQLKAAAARVNPTEAAKQVFAPPQKSLADQLAEWQAFTQSQQGQPGAPSAVGTPAPELYPKFNAKGQASLGARLPQVAQGMDSRTFQELLKKHNGNLNAARTEANQMMEQSAKVKSKGTQEGALEVKSGTPYLQNQTDIAAAKTKGGPIPAGVEDALARGGTLDRLLGQIESGFNPDFLGPIKGSDSAFSFRTKFGSAINQPMAPGETAFRENLQSAKNLIVYLQTGKQINEAEAGRLDRVLPNAQMEPKVFQDSLRRFRQEMQTILEEHRKAGGMTRGGLSAGAAPAAPAANLAPPPAGWR